MSRAIQRLGGSSTALYAARGLRGELLGELLEREEIETRPVNLKGVTRENFIVRDQNSGELFHFVMPGSEMADDDWRQVLEALEELDPFPAYVVASGSAAPGVPDDFYGCVAGIVEERQGRFVMRASGPCLEQALTDHRIYLVKLSLESLREYAGKRLPEETDQQEAARRILEQGASEVVVVSFADAGALVVTHTKVEHIRAPSVEVESDAGAGDSMLAGIVLRLAQDAPVLDAVRYGIAAGTATVMEPGMELCSRERTDRIYQQISSEGQVLGIPDMSDLSNVRR